jgi:hypothetical protein
VRPSRIGDHSCIYRLGRLKEAGVARPTDVVTPPEGEVPTRTQGMRDLGVGHGRVEPVEGGRLSHQIEGASLELHAFEVPNNDLAPWIPRKSRVRDSGEVRA